VEPVWRPQDSTRFWDSHAGAGPRSTPTLNNGRLYTLGATGILNVLDAENGTLLWSRNIGADTRVTIPEWGFTSSPLVVDNAVVLAAAGTLVAYDLNTGNPRWLGPDGGAGYSSPHLMTIEGSKQILLMTESGLISMDPYTGTLLWRHNWPGEQIVQPAQVREGDLLLSSGGLKGIHRIRVAKGSGEWTTEASWSSVQLKPNFNDFVVHKGYAYGYYGPMIACIEIENGNRMWKGERYGGQLILLADQDLLLVTSEQGELFLVEAIPDQYSELARFPAIEGKTWNHPVLAGDILVIRNCQEMAAFQLTLAEKDQELP
jgi:outer membrane protein assembly factor BamB